MILTGISGTGDMRTNIRVDDPKRPFQSYDSHSTNLIMMGITALTTTCYRKL